MTWLTPELSTALYALLSAILGVLGTLAAQRQLPPTPPVAPPTPPVAPAPAPSVPTPPVRPELLDRPLVRSMLSILAGMTPTQIDDYALEQLIKMRDEARKQKAAE